MGVPYRRPFLYNINVGTVSIPNARPMSLPICPAASALINNNESLLEAVNVESTVTSASEFGFIVLRCTLAIRTNCGFKYRQVRQNGALTNTIHVI